MGKAVPEVNWGTLEVRNELLPAWETHYPAAFCEMDAGARGVVIEGRFQRPAFNAQITELLGEDMNVNADSSWCSWFDFGHTGSLGDSVT